MFYYRNPGDARMKVGSEREFATSDNSAKTRQIRVSPRSLVFIVYSVRGDPPKLALL